MKKFLFMSLLLASSFALKAGVADYFNLDKSFVATEMAELNALETFVQENSGLTYADVAQADQALVANIMPLDQSHIGIIHGEPALGIPGFVWGFCCGLLGILIVYLVAKDTDQTKQAAIGCLVSGLVSVILQVLGSVL